MVPDSPIPVNRLDDKAQRWTDSVHVLVHQLLDDRGFTGIVQSPDTSQHTMRSIHITLRTALGFSFPCPSVEPCAVLTALLILRDSS